MNHLFMLVQRNLVLSALFILCGSQVAQADIIVLKNGQKIEADVLKENSEALYIDLGVEIVRVPLTQIVSRKSAEKEQKHQQETSGKNQFYTTARLKPLGIKELTEKYGQGVVLIQTPGGLGSGFLINNRGYCVTNYHVIEKETRIAATIYDKSANGDFRKIRIDNVKIIALNPFFDLALLQLPEHKEIKFQPVVLAKDHDYKEGGEVFAIGNPLGLERSVSRGIVSRRNRNFGGLIYIQTTTQINPGNSGGPLFNSRGEVIGVTNMKLTFGEGLGFAIPIDYLKQFLKNRDAFAFDKNNPNTGYRYLEAPRKRKMSTRK